MAKKDTSKPDEYPTLNRVDGNNVSRIANDPRPLEVERGHTYWTNERTGKRVEKPDWASDRD